MKLLSVGSNAKTKKSDAGGEYLTGIMYLAPHTLAGGKSLCPGSTAGCREACLYTAGRGSMNSVQTARIAKAEWYLEDKKAFKLQLWKELNSFAIRCVNNGIKPAVRLNGTTDILWERTEIIQGYPDIRFYDYTKVISKMFL